MLGASSILNKCRVYRLRQFQQQNYLIGRMSALAISSSAAHAWLLFNGERSLGEISMRLCLCLGRPIDELQEEVRDFAEILLQKDALKLVSEVLINSSGDQITVHDVRIPAALLWGGYSN